MQKDFQGVRINKGKTEFCVRSPMAERVDLCLFTSDEKEETIVPMVRDDNGFWHAEFSEKLEGQKYGYRTHGEYNPYARRFFNSNKLLIDPYAYEITKSLHNISDYEKHVLLGNNDLNSAEVAPKSVVRFLDKTELAKKFPYLYQKPHIEWGKTHIYELNVGNYTALHPDILPKDRGRLAAIGQTINYLKSLSYNQIEFMPLTPTMADWQLQQTKGLSDQWGYNPINHHAIDPRYGNIYDFLSLINTLHQNGIEVSMDMVFNHTGEFMADGFLLSYKGLDPEGYYRFDNNDGYSFVNTTGCKNGFNPNTVQGSHLIKSSLMFFADTCGVDAFRFDLAGDCALNNDLAFDANGKFMQVVREVADITGAKMSGEPWSACGGYYLGKMTGLSEWNDKHEKTLRQFIRGDYGVIGKLAFHMAGSEANGKINIFTKHDGATQYDWATYSQKNNFENNENNQDGSNDNHYSPSINDAQRLIKTKTAHALNTLARGVPLSLSGDELWHTQNGNNNGYAKSFPLQWQNFSKEQRERYIFERKVNAFRQSHPVFSSIENATPDIMPNGSPAWDWKNIHGETMKQNDWDYQYNRFLGYVLNGEDQTGHRYDDDFFVMTSGNSDFTMKVRLPATPHKGNWQVVFDTSKLNNEKDILLYKQGDDYYIKPHSMVVMICRRSTAADNKRQLYPMINKGYER